MDSLTGLRGHVLATWVAGALWTAGLGPVASAGDPAHYVKRETWHDTFRASAEALLASAVEDPFEPFETGVVRGGEPARRVSVDVSGARDLWLFATGCPDVIWGVADWGDPVLIDPDGSRTSLAVVGSYQAVEGQHELNVTLRSGLYQKLRVGGRMLERGINVLADSALRVPLDGRQARFEAWVGVDDWSGGKGNVRFAVTGARTAARRLLWSLVERDFPGAEPRGEMRREREDGILDREWRTERELAERYAAAARGGPRLHAWVADAARGDSDESDLRETRRRYHRSRELAAARAELSAFPFESVRLAVTDLAATFGDRYPTAASSLGRLARLAEEAAASLRDPEPSDRELAILDELRALRRDALLANPLLDFDRLLVVRRVPRGDPRRDDWADRGLGEYVGMPRQSSWGLGTMTDTMEWDNEISVLSPVRPSGRLETLWRPPGRRLVTDVDLHWDGTRLLVSMPDARGRWQVCEVSADGRSSRQLTPGDQPDVHCYDACYLPSGKVVFVSTAPLQGVPCNAGVIVGMLYRMEADGSGIEQICFEQDHDYTPSVLNDGRVLYLRWDYTDTPHVWNRVLMGMNPDGTSQMEYYGSNSYWPNAVFFARAIPGHPTKVAGIVTGHHEGRVGELVIFDPALGRRETEGVVQRIPGRGTKVEPAIEDKLTEHSWPKLLHPWPLSDKYFLVAGKPTPDSLWGIWLVDVFDNMVLVKEEEGRCLLEPIPLRPRARPPEIAETPRGGGNDALVYLSDVHSGPGLAGIPRGTVRSLRVFTYHFGYQRLAGIDHRVGADGPWEVKRVLGTVPVEEDGSAFFRVPAKVPISVQPLDSEGRAVALMRSWMTAMPGETLSCVGCHEHQSTPALNRRGLALRRVPSEIEPWYGPPRGFSFRREVQPVLDRHCVGCHDGRPRPDGGRLVDLRGDQGAWVVYEHGEPDLETILGARLVDLVGKYAGVFDPAYVALRKHVRVGGLESDLHPLPPMEFHADTSELVQMLRKGHQGVQLDREAWDRLVVWIDLNAPCHGTWSEVTRVPGNQRERRVALRRLYGGVVEDCEEVAAPEAARPAEPIVPPPRNVGSPVPVSCDGWPFDAAEAAARQRALGSFERSVDLGGGLSLDLVRVPAGSFVLGDALGDPDEAPRRVDIRAPFWMSRHEITNEQYARFDPTHESRFEHRTSWIFSEEYLGWRLDGPRQPVVRVSWDRAAEFCAWLSARLGETVDLPTEEQWEWACRAGTDAPFSWGGLGADFSRFANLGDRRLRDLAWEGWRPRAPDLVARDDRFDDGALVTVAVGSYAPNAWGLHDLHGNAAEWTRTAWTESEAATAVASTHGVTPRSGISPAAARGPSEPRLEVVRGGSWRDRPARCRASFRVAYAPYQRVFNVGFRIVVEGASTEVAGGGR